jgi:DNA-binding SARP family transcriptional activator/tetratricopeptide (TPR) repeat protein
MARLEISLLGSFQVMIDGQPVKAFEADKARAILAYLAIEADRSHRREILAGMFWPDRDDTIARKNLRQALYRIRQAIGDPEASPSYLFISSHEIQFNEESDHWIDAVEFKVYLNDYRKHHPQGTSLCESCLKKLQRSFDLYRGEFLSRFSSIDSPDFEWWLLSQKETFHRLSLEALSQLGSYYEFQRDYALAIECAQREIALEPWREAAHRQLMHLLAISGHRGAALRQCQECQQILVAELEVEPSRETTRLYERIRGGEFEAAEDLPRRTFSAPKPPLETTFVARERELDQLERYMKAALAGQGRVVFIKGEAGSGKTMLVHEFARLASEIHSDLLVVGSSCNAYTGIGDPYLPFIEILGMINGDLEPGRAGTMITEEQSQRLWHAFPTFLKNLVELSPDLVGTFLPGASLLQRARSHGGVRQTWVERLQTPVAYASPGEPQEGLIGPGPMSSGQIALFAQITQILQALAKHHPLLLILDDLQWVDRGSASLLFHLGRRLENARILILGAYRPEEVAIGVDGGRHPLESVIHEFKGHFGDIEIDLSRTEGRRFVEAYLDQEPNCLGRAFRETLYQHTEGHPLFTVELLRGLQERGDLLRDEDSRWVKGPSLDWEHLPPRVEAVIAERLSHLPAEGRAILDVASVQGETFIAEVAAEVMDLREDVVSSQLSGALSKKHRLVHAQSVQHTGEKVLSHYRFRHHLYQQYLHGRLDKVERAKLHGITGETLEELCGGESGDQKSLKTRASRLAWHFEQAGMVTKALEHLLKAGEEAFKISASKEAIAYYSKSLEILKALPEGIDRTQQELVLHLRRWGPLKSIQGYAGPNVAQTITKINDLSQVAGDVQLLFMSKFLLALFNFFVADYEGALDLGKQIVTMAREAKDEMLIAYGNLCLGSTYVLMGELSPGRVHLEEALVKVRSDESSLHLSISREGIRLGCLALFIMNLWALGFPDQALACCQEGQDLVQLLPQQYPHAFFMGQGTCMINMLYRDYGQVKAWADSLVELSTKRGYTLYQALGKIFLGRAQAAHSQTEEGLANLRQGFLEYRATGQKVASTFHMALEVEILAQIGQVEEGLSILREAFQFVKDSGERFYEAELHRLQGELLLCQTEGRAERIDGDHHRLAEDCFQRAIAIARRQEAKSLELRAVMSLSRLLQQQSRGVEAYPLLEEIYNWFTEGLDTPDLMDARELLEQLSLQNS